MKFLIMVCFLLVCIAPIYSQNGYYTETKTFYEDGYTYQCEVCNDVLVILYNADKRFIGKPLIDKRTGKEYDNAGQPLFEEETWSKPKCYSIINQTFTPEEKARLTGKELLISLYIDAQTGKIADVEFRFFAKASFDPYATIPVSTYRQVEIELKKNVWFKPTAEGKNLNYIPLFWMQDPNVTIKNVPATPPGGLKSSPTTMITEGMTRRL